MKFIFVSILLTVIMAISACKKSSNSTGGGGGGGGTTFTPNCNGAAIVFTADVSPIFQSVCSQSGCHNSGSVNGPGALTNYAQINASKSNIRAAIISGAMPKNTTLTAAQKNSIICWIDAGAPDN
jgi:hypothetical protein